MRRIFLLAGALALAACAPELEHAGLRVVPEGTTVELLSPVGAAPFAFTSLSREGDPARALPAAGDWSHADARLVRPFDGGVWWWRRAPTGLEFGLDLSSPPPGEGPLLAHFALPGATITVLPGGESARIELRDGALALVGLAAWDADGQPLYARLLPTEEGLTLRVEDADAAYPITIDPVLTSDLRVLAGSPAARTGYGLAALDANGDGFDDLVVGEPYFDGAAGTDTGRVQLFLGSASGVSATPVWTWEGTAAFDRAGRILANLGDLNASGGQDLGVGVPDADPGSVSGAGSALVFYALPAAPWFAATPDFTHSGTTVGENCGGSLAEDADFDGDGVSDLAVGCPEGHVPGNSSDPGRVDVLYGQPGGFSIPVAVSSLLGVGNEDELGSSIANAGDVNGDGYDDLIVGAEDYESATLSDDGYIAIHLGSSVGISTSPWTSWTSGQNGSRLGSRVAPAGDVNGDGFADVLVVAERWDRSFSDEGRVTLHLGSPAGVSASPALAWFGEQSLAQAGGKETSTSSGGSGALAGDFDNDGLSDVAVSAWRYDGPATDSGRIEVFGGSSSGVTPYPRWTGAGDTASARAGYALGSGDFDGDGRADLAIGEWGFDASAGRVRVLPGPLAGVDGAEVITAGSSNSSFSGGDRWRAVAVTMTQDAVLAAIDTPLSPSAPTNLLFSVYEATSPTGTHTLLAQLARSSAPGATQVGTGPMEVLLQAGRSYVISTWWEGIAGYSNGAESLPQPLGSYGSVIGYRTGSGAPPATLSGPSSTGVLYPTILTLLPPSDGDGDGNYAALDCQDGLATNTSGGAELCDGLDNDCDGSADFAPSTFEVTTTTTLASTNTLKGNRYLCTAPTRVTEVQVFTEASSQGAVSLGIYQGAGPSGPWTLLAERAAVPSSTAAGWLSFDGLDLLLSPGTDYAFVYQWLGGATYFWASGAQNPPWGTQTGGLSQSATALPADGAAITENPSRYRMRILSSEEFDQDGDGSFACLDCDDGDPAFFPGQVELCDGLDNDCDGTPDADPGGEVDADGDGFRSCAECDDGAALSFPGAPELCDGLDNDCNGALPASEVDGDGDAVPPCAGDCDDGDASTFPGAEESCDLADNDCDGLIDDDARVIVAGAGGLAVPPSGTLGTTLALASALSDGVISDVDVVIDLTHSFDGDLELRLTSPSGAIVLLSQNRGGSGDDYSGTRFDDEATVPIASGAAPFSGSFQPEQALASFDATRLGGAWTLSALDEVSGDAGTLLSWSVQAAIAGAADSDGDGSLACFDCDEQDPLIGPGAPELCDGLDGDCDGLVPPNEADGDGDGARLCDGDCDDADPARFPASSELCDGVDNDCDGIVPPNEADADGDGARLCDGDCDDGNAALAPGLPEVCDGWDNDCSGALGATETDADGDFFLTCPYQPGGNPAYGGSDCDDGAAQVYPGAPEVCDGVDNNCNGTTADEGSDVDGDGFSTCTDCDDSSSAIFPGAPEGCDGADSDCDGALAPAELDGDGDGQAPCEGDCNDGVASIFLGAPEGCDGLDTDCGGGPAPNEVDGDGDGTRLCAGDCDDASPSVYPGASELCDGLDNDCNGALPTVESDADGDGVSTCAGDCNDANPASYPGASEVCDGLDNDCDGALPTNEQDGDGDGQSPCAGDCDDAAPTVSGGAPEVCDGVDNDCNGALLPSEVDGDGDGTPPCLGDCNDAAPSVYPGASEACDGLDDDCDGVVPANEADADLDGVRICAGDCDDAAATVAPGAPELCNGVDDDCVPATSAPGGEVDGDGDGSLSCLDCDDGDPSNAPSASELCDGADNDCDGLPDADPLGEVDGDGDGSLSCLDCDDSDVGVYPGAPELCDGLDNDCDTGTEPPGGEEDADADGSPGCLDCDDDDPANTPGAVEACDGADNDCDPSTEAAGGEGDGDGDGALSCLDCDDADPAVLPGALEACDGLDNDCDGVVPLAEADGDADGWRLCDGDCNDSDAAVSPDSPELCDGQDNDCDSSTNELADLDGDGFTICDGDCDDEEPAAWPGAPELCDGLDNDCEPGTDEASDDDGDGLSECEGDCEDGEASVNPFATEVCDGFDTDCDPSTTLALPEADEDGDLSFTCDEEPDCDDEDPDSYPGAPELCDGVDNNCDGMFDDAIEDSDGDGFSPCEGDCDDTAQAVNPNALEGCDGLDTNCDGELPAVELDGDEDGAAPCEGDCDDGEPQVGPSQAEDCEDGLDNDCDGELDLEDADCAPSGDDDDDSSGDDDDDDVTPAPPEPAGCGCNVWGSKSVPGTLSPDPFVLVGILGVFGILRRRRSLPR